MQEYDEFGDPILPSDDVFDDQTISHLPEYDETGDRIYPSANYGYNDND